MFSEVAKKGLRSQTAAAVVAVAALEEPLSERSEKKRRGNARGRQFGFGFVSVRFGFGILVFACCFSGSARLMPDPFLSLSTGFPSTHRRLVFFSVGCVDVSHFVCIWKAKWAECHAHMPVYVPHMVHLSHLRRRCAARCCLRSAEKQAMDFV